MRRALVAAATVAIGLTLVMLGFGALRSGSDAAATPVDAAYGHHHGPSASSWHHRPKPTTTATTTTTTTAPTSTTTSEPTTSTPTSAPTGTPGDGSVGVPPGTDLTPSGSLTASKDGQVIDGLDVHGTITVTAKNVVIKNSRFTGDGSEVDAIRTQGDGSVLIQDSTIEGDYSDAGIAYHNWTAERVDISGMSNDGAKVGNNVTVKDSKIHDFKPASGAHGDGLQVVEDVGHITITGNTIDIGKNPGANSAVFLCPDIGPELDAGPITVSDNTLGGGGYTFYNVGGTDGAVLQDVTLKDNTFNKDSIYGAIYPSDVTPTTHSGNVYPDGSPVPWP